MIEKILGNIKLITESGISMDIAELLKEQNDILHYNIAKENEGFIIDIKLTKFNSDEVKLIFFSIINFIQYSYFTYYQTNAGPDNIHYDFVTGNNYNIGFYCKFNFT